MDITIFDFDVTQAEIKHLFVNYVDRGEYIQNTSYKKRLQDLYVLFKMREDKVRAREILNEITQAKEVAA
jgi:regulatory protein YycH of two-component signal transduction system YycFG